MGIKRLVNNLMMKGKKHSPELLLLLGIGSGIAATVVACRATLNADEVLDEHAENMEKIAKAEEIEANDEEKGMETALENSAKDKAIVYGRTIGGFIKLYAPAAALGALSLACILGSYGIMKKRNIALTGAYMALEKVHKAYRDRVREEEGIDKDLHYLYGTKKEKMDVVEVDANGKEKHKTIESEVRDTSLPNSDYAKWFDQSSKFYEKSSERNLLFLKGQEKVANELLNARGHLFLNEVYDMLDIPRTAAGAVTGWVKGNGDDYVDFGIYENNDAARDFVNGWEREVKLDFNVDGVIWDKI